jgi:acetyl-CoA acetyltransferase
MVIASGLAETVVIYRSLKGRSGKRMGQISHGSEDGHEEQFITPYGRRGPVNTFALTAQRWLHNRGHHQGDLSAVAVQQRKHASNNERALFREPLSKEAYFDAPMIASPLRRLDCCLETDGACAVVLTSLERARQLGTAPVVVHGAVRGGGPGGSYWDKAESLDEIFSAFIAKELFQVCGMAPSDIDLAYLYDAYSFLVPAQLEDFGFCSRGEAIPFIEQGETLANGSLPVNTNGGMLNEGYVHGLNNVIEAVLQLRGDQGERQVSRSNTALCSGFGGRYGSAAILLSD